MTLDRLRFLEYVLAAIPPLERRLSGATNDCRWGVGTMGITGECVQRYTSGKNLQLATVSSPK